MTKIRRKYSKEKKLEIIKLSLEEGMSVKSVAASFDVSSNTIYNWRSKYFKNEESSFPGHGNKTMTAIEREVDQLRKELREAQLERDILKKAVSIFSKGDSKYSSL